MDQRPDARIPARAATDEMAPRTPRSLGHVTRPHAGGGTSCPFFLWQPLLRLALCYSSPATDHPRQPPIRARPVCPQRARRLLRSPIQIQPRHRHPRQSHNWSGLYVVTGNEGQQRDAQAQIESERRPMSRASARPTIRTVPHEMHTRGTSNTTREQNLVRGRQARRTKIASRNDSCGQTLLE
jgi:hypothetical protein